MNRRYLVILADRQRGRFFTIYLGTFEDQGEEFIDEDVPQKVKAEDGRVGKIGRHIRDHLYHHLKHVGKEALNYLVKRRIRQLDGVIIGSHKELLTDIERFLPSILRKKVKVKFVTNIDVPAGDLSEKIMKKFNL